jgi:hypothetical protein
VASSGGADLILQFRLERGRRHDEVLSKDKTDVANSSWLHGKEVLHNAAVWQRRSEQRRHRRGEMEETTPDDLTRILQDQKMKKIHTVDSVAINGL